MKIRPPDHGQDPALGTPNTPVAVRTTIKAQLFEHLRWSSFAALALTCLLYAYFLTA